MRSVEEQEQNEEKIKEFRNDKIPDIVVYRRGEVCKILLKFSSKLLSL